jgi:hypothetical protein
MLGVGSIEGVDVLNVLAHPANMELNARGRRRCRSAPDLDLIIREHFMLNSMTFFFI